MEIHLVVSLSHGNVDAIYAYETVRLAKAKAAELISELGVTDPKGEFQKDLFRSIDGCFEVQLLTLPVHTEGSM